MKTIDAELLERVGQILRTAGWSKYRLSRELGLSGGNVGRWFDGEVKELRPGTYRALVEKEREVLGHSPEDQKGEEKAGDNGQHIAGATIYINNCVVNISKDADGRPVLIVDGARQS